MRGSAAVARPVLAMTLGLLLAAPALAQLARVNGTVRDEDGHPLRGATVVAENPDATPDSFTAVTSDKGQFSMIGLRGGTWRFTASAPGFIASSGTARIRTIGSNPPIAFNLAHNAASGGGVLAGVHSKDVQALLTAADAMMEAGRYDEAIAGYREVLAKAPALTTVNLQVGRALRLKREYDVAIAVYREWLAADAGNERATIELGMTQLEKGALAEADATLAAAAQSASAGKDVYFSLGEVKLARSQYDDAVRFYLKAADADPSWVKPLLRLGLVAANQGNNDVAARYLERVVALDPSSGEAAQAKAILDQLRR